ncbi:MAG: extracellular solute-binding protein [Phycisphaeraceae bacterium]|nr:extracellular solute-binding protein [Phycisphaeraceae bacterium]
MSIILRGITWNHTRGYDPLVATASAYTSLHPNVSIEWERRPLMAFGEMPVDQLAEDYDLVVLDHPWVGFMAESGCYRAIDLLIPPPEMEQLERYSAGPSHHSYYWQGHQWALAIDAACMCASYRSDLLQAANLTVPETWDDVLILGRCARKLGLTINMPLNHIDAISAFLSVVNNMGAKPFQDNLQVVDHLTGQRALSLLHDVATLCPPTCYDDTPVSIMDRMGSADYELYCPLAYSYNNYARSGYRTHVCHYHNMPSCGDWGPRGSHLGGAGLSISAHCREPDVAADYALMTAGPMWQRTVYFEGGGQPGHASAWRDPQVNAASNNFFYDTWESICQAYVRPRYKGYIDFQHHAGMAIRTYLKIGQNAEALLQELDTVYQQSLVSSVESARNVAS